MTDQPTTTTPAIPEFLVKLGVKHGVPIASIPDEWADYCAWSADKWPGRPLGGSSWSNWCERASDRYLKLTQGEAAKLAEARMIRATEQKIHGEQEALYSRSAMTFNEYAALLERRRDNLEPLAEHEASVATWWAGLTQAERRIDRRAPLAFFGKYLAHVFAQGARA
jgi:hypothetical protein